MFRKDLVVVAKSRRRSANFAIAPRISPRVTSVGGLPRTKDFLSLSPLQKSCSSALFLKFFLKVTMSGRQAVRQLARQAARSQQRTLATASVARSVARPAAQKLQSTSASFALVSRI